MQRPKHEEQAVSSNQTTEEAPTAHAASATIAAPNNSMESIGKQIQDLFHSDKTKVNDALDALNLDLMNNENKCDKIQAAGGCLALVQLVKECLKKATEKISACDRVFVFKLQGPDELKNLFNLLNTIYNLTSYHNKSRIGISSVGGVEAIFRLWRHFQCAMLCRRQHVLPYANYQVAI
jgi:hypothetical protein